MHTPSRTVRSLAANLSILMGFLPVNRPGVIHSVWRGDGPKMLAPNPTQQPAVLRQQMQTPQIVPLNGMGTVAIGTPIPLTIPRTATYDAIFFEFSAGGTPLSKAQLAAQVAKVEVVLDADHIWELTGTELLALGQYELGTFQDNTGVLVLPFARRDMRLPATEDLVSLGTIGVDTFQVLVTLAAGATIDTILPSAQTRPNDKLGRYITYRRQIWQGIATGEVLFPTVAQGPGWHAGSIHFIGAADAALTVSQVRLYAFGGFFRDTSKILNDEILRRSGKTPQAGWVHLDFNFRGRGNDPFPLNVNDFTPRLVFGAAPGTVQTLLERWEERKVAA